jgi:hypothetical protein
LIDLKFIKVKKQLFKKSNCSLDISGALSLEIFKTLVYRNRKFSLKESFSAKSVALLYIAIFRFIDIASTIAI